MARNKVRSQILCLKKKRLIHSRYQVYARRRYETKQVFKKLITKKIFSVLGKAAAGDIHGKNDKIGLQREEVLLAIENQ